ncbi:protein msta [Eurytemora carolleeae]|uniref:protein msta n=1 Tax=Eurytemora carolleeae TaxID=1294199 RepID=UPI000C77DCC7|nr:protein msta [Eurytemora carolleeae]|eukprot:XP_023325036.1 protein msta-like [Eurytemora affinis]
MENLDPVLFRILETEENSRHLVALRDLEAGELIFSEHPVAVGPGDSQGSCIVCSRDTQAVCSRCWWTLCQRCVHSDIHQEECRLLSSCTVKGPELGLPTRHVLSLRCILLKKNLRIWEKLQGLCDHGLQSLDLSPDILNQDPGLRDLVSFIRDDCGLNYSIEDISSVYLAATSSCIIARSEGISLHGVYLQGGLLTHSCIQNTRIIIKGDQPKMFVYASVPIKKGEKITYCRLPEVVPIGTLERRRLLRESFLDCHCKRCCDPTECSSYTSSIYCQRCEGVCIPLNPLNQDCTWKCLSCQETVDGRFVSTLLLSIREDIKTFQGSRSQRYRTFREQNKRILHPNHYLHTAERAKFFLQFSVEESVEDTLLKISAGKDMLELVDVLDPGLSIFRESLLVNLGTNLQLLLSDEIVRRQSSDTNTENLADTQVYAGFRDALFCFKEARKAAELEGCKSAMTSIDENISILEEMRQYFESITH